MSTAEWEQEHASLKTQRGTDYTKPKDTRVEVAELQNIRKCINIIQKAGQPERMQAKKYERER